MNLYLSRSPIETFRACPRQYFYNYCYQHPEKEFRGKITGVIPKLYNVFFELGTAVHEGIHRLDKSASNIGEVMDTANDYIKKCGEIGWYNVDHDNEYAQDFTTKELANLASSLLYCWYFFEFHELSKKYSIIAKEKPISEVFKIGESDNLIYEYRPDALLRDRQTGDVINYSLKTVTNWDWRSALDYQNALQVYTEIYGAEKILESAIAAKPELKAKLPTKVRGTRFCFLVKGNREKVYGENGSYSHDVIDNPLLRGYKNIMGGSITYAHEKRYPKPENKSGYGLLTKGWEEFRIAEEPTLGNSPLERLKNWIDKIRNRETIGLKQGLEAILGNTIVLPDEYTKSEEEVREVIIGFKATSAEILRKLKAYEAAKVNGKEKWGLANHFPKTHSNCTRYGKCTYYDVCHKGSDIDILVADGVFKSREPHHKEEKKLITTEERKP